VKNSQSQSELTFRMLAGLKTFMLVGALGAIVMIAGRLALAPMEASTVETTPIAAPFEATAMSADGVVGDAMQSIDNGNAVAIGQPAVAR
jgi:hypothetical protein